jgi:hypothetical protein
MKQMMINKKPYFEYEEKDFELNKWYVFGSRMDYDGTSPVETTWRDGPYNTKREATAGMCSPIHRESKGVYQCERSHIMTGKTAIETGYSEWCYEIR